VFAAVALAGGVLFGDHVFAVSLSAFVRIEKGGRERGREGGVVVGDIDKA